MKRGGSLRTRLLIGALLWGGGVFLAGLALSAALFRDHLGQRYRLILGAHLDELEELVTMSEDGALTLARSLSDPRFRRADSGLYWQIAVEGLVVLRSPSLADGRVGTLDSTPGGSIYGEGEPRLASVSRILTLPDGSAALATVAAEEKQLDPSHVSHSRLSLMAVLSMLLVAVGLMAAGVILVNRGLRPLEELRDRLAAIRTGATTRLVGEVPSEVEPLVADLNALLEHNERVVERARSNTGNLAHGLKTPLAMLANEAERLVARGERSTADFLRQQTRAMQRHVDVHLAQARAAASSRGLGVRSPVGPALDRLVRTLRSLYDGQSVRLSAETEVGSVFRGESVDLEEMLGSLLDNACKWAASKVEARCVRIGDEILVTVDDDGPGLDRKKRDAVFVRGARLDESVPASGLGLAIVRDLAEAYGGSVMLSDSPLGGLRTILTLPAT